jgi:hypothetical protein
MAASYHLGKCLVTQGLARPEADPMSERRAFPARALSARAQQRTEPSKDYFWLSLSSLLYRKDGFDT